LEDVWPALPVVIAIDVRIISAVVKCPLTVMEILVVGIRCTALTFLALS